MNHRKAVTLAAVAFTAVALAAAPPRTSSGASHAGFTPRPGAPKRGALFGERFINYGSGLCLQPRPESGQYFLNGLSIMQYVCLDPDSVPSQQQQWSLIFMGSGSIAGRSGSWNRYHIVNYLTGQCLDDRDGSTVDGAPMQQWTCNNTSTTMLWTLGRSSGGFGELINARSGKCLDIRGGSLQAWAVVQQYHCTTTSTNINYAQLFAFF